MREIISSIVLEAIFMFISTPPPLESVLGIMFLLTCIKTHTEQWVLGCKRGFLHLSIRRFFWDFFFLFVFVCFLPVDFHVFQQHLLKTSIFLHWITFVSLSNAWVYLTYVGLFLRSLLCSIDLCVCPFTNTTKGL